MTHPTLHPSGFKIYLDAEQLRSSDEYHKGDPYSVDNEGISVFHQRRFDMTAELVGKALSLLGTKARVLDVGCGKGHITENLRARYPGHVYCGFDYSVSAIAAAHAAYPDIEFVCADAYDPPYENERFDIVICNNIWEHVPDPLALLRGLKKIMRKDAFLIISTPSRYRLGNLLRVLAGNPVVFMSRHHVTEYTVGQVIEQLRWEGLETISFGSPAMVSRRLVPRLVKTFLHRCLEQAGSHHTLEATVFYLARRTTNPVPPV